MTTRSTSNGSSNNSYFAQSLRVLSMLMMSGNMLDYSQLQLIERGIYWLMSQKLPLIAIIDSTPQDAL